VIEMSNEFNEMIEELESYRSSRSSIGAYPTSSSDYASFSLGNGVQVNARKFFKVLVVNIFDAVGGWCSIVYELDSDGEMSSMGELLDTNAIKVKEEIEKTLRT
jgi:hypothetical protein